MDTLDILITRALRTRRGKNWEAVKVQLELMPRQLTGVCEYLLNKLEPEKDKLTSRDAVHCIDLFYMLQEFGTLPNELYSRVLTFASFFLGQSPGCDAAIDRLKRGDEYARIEDDE